VSQWASRFPAGRRIELVAAAERLRASLVDWRQAIKIDHFVKRENLLHQWEDGTTLYNPRAISARKPEFQAATGPFYYTVGKWLANAWNADHFLIYASGYDAVTLGKVWEKAKAKFNARLGFDDDHGTFDAHQKDEATRVETKTWSQLAPNYPETTKIAIRKTPQTIGASPHHVVYKARFTRKSGDSNTSCGNTDHNGGTQVFRLEKGSESSNLDSPMALLIVKGSYPATILVIGDDGLAAGRHEYLEVMMRDPTLTVMGFETKPHLGPIVQSEFCSSRFLRMRVAGEVQLVLIPKLGRCIAKLFFCHNDYPDPLSWVRGVVECMALLVGDLPYFRVVFPAVLALTEGHKTMPIYLEEHKFYANVQCHLVPETWQDLSDIYGITKSEFEDLEAYMLKTGITLHGEYDHPVLRRLVEVDVDKKPNLVPHETVLSCSSAGLQGRMFPNPRVHRKFPLMSTKGNKNNGSADQLAKRIERLTVRAEKAAAQAVSGRSKSNTAPAVKELISAASRSGALANRVQRAVIGSIVDPFDFGLIRFPGGYATRPTAIAKLFYHQPVLWDTTDATTPGSAQLPVSDTVAIIFRDPRRALIVYDPNVSGSQWSYNFVVVTDTTTQGTGGVNIVWPIHEYLKWSYALATTGYTPHGVYATPFIDPEGVTYFWVDATAANPTTFSVAGLANSTAYAFELRMWLNGEITETLFTNTTSGSGVWTQGVSISGYYTISNKAQNLTPSMIYVTGTSSVFCHLHMPGLLNNVFRATNVRTLSATLMYTNEAAPLYKQGKILSYQCPAGDEWTEYVTPDGSASGSFSELATLNGIDISPIENGRYGWLGPSSDLDFAPVVIADGPTAAGSIGAANVLPCPLVPVNDFVVMYAQITQQLGRDGYWTPVWGIEYESVDQWTILEKPIVSPEDYMMAIFRSSQLPQFHDNPLHLSDITGFLKAMAGPVAAGLSGAGQAIGGPVGGGLTALGGLIGVIDGVVNKPGTTASNPAPQSQTIVKRTVVVGKKRGKPRRPR
jgi:hypothetical protein